MTAHGPSAMNAHLPGRIHGGRAHVPFVVAVDVVLRHHNGQVGGAVCLSHVAADESMYGSPRTLRCVRALHAQQPQCQQPPIAIVNQTYACVGSVKHTQA